MKLLIMKPRLIHIFLMILFASTVARTQTVDLPILDVAYRPLLSCRDQSLNQKLWNVLRADPKMRRLIRCKKMSVGLVDISDPKNPRFASVNGDHMMYAASLPKIAVLLAVQYALEDGSLVMNDNLHALMIKMISLSDNNCTTELIDMVGFEKIAAVLQDSLYNFYDQEKDGGIWVGKRYGKGGVKNPDPLKGLSHAASATQVCRFYYMLAYGRLINCERSIEMLEILKDPMLHHKFVNVLDHVCPNADVYRKSGTWRTYHSDSVLVIGDAWRSYILVALVDDVEGGRLVKEVISKVDRMLEPGFNTKA